VATAVKHQHVTGGGTGRWRHTKPLRWLDFFEVLSGGLLCQRGANKVSAAAPRCQHGVKSPQETTAKIKHV